MCDGILIGCERAVWGRIVPQRPWVLTEHLSQVSIIIHAPLAHSVKVLRPWPRGPLKIYTNLHAFA